MARVLRKFIDCRYGQMHLRFTTPAAPTRPPLVCLHMSPKSGRCFAALMRVMGDDRVMVAPDYPGYGESDLPPETPHVRIEDYAACVWEAVDALGLGRVDLLGYHTGSKVAVEMAGQRGAGVRKIALLSASVFTPAELDQIKAYFEPIPLDEDGTRFKTMWSRVVEYRGPGMTLEMMAESFAENLRGGEAYEWGHRAAFDYCGRFEEVLASLDHPIRVINPGDDLSEQTRRAAPLLRNGEIEERPEWGHGFLEAYTEDAAACFRAFLDAD